MHNIGQLVLSDVIKEIIIRFQIFVMILSTTLAEPPSSSYGLPSISSGTPSISYGTPSKSGWETTGSSGWESSGSSGWETVAVAPSTGWDLSGVSSGYSYDPLSADTHYVSRPVGHIPNEGLHIDHKLLETIKQILISHENAGGSKISTYPSDSYGPPEWKGWKSNKVWGIDFEHARQSIPVAYYLGKTSYAPAHKGWTLSKPTGWVSKPTTTYGVPSKW